MAGEAKPEAAGRALQGGGRPRARNPRSPPHRTGRRLDFARTGAIPPDASRPTHSRLPEGFEDGFHRGRDFPSGSPPEIDAACAGCPSHRHYRLLSGRSGFQRVGEYVRSRSRGRAMAPARMECRLLRWIGTLFGGHDVRSLRRSRPRAISGDGLPEKRPRESPPGSLLRACPERASRALPEHVRRCRARRRGDFG